MVLTGFIFFRSLIMENEAAGKDWQIIIVVEEKLNNHLIKKFRNLTSKSLAILLWTLQQVNYILY